LRGGDEYLFDRSPSSSIRCSVLFFGILLLALTPSVGLAQADKAPGQLESPATRDIRRTEALKEEIRHQLVMLPYYSVFDWLQAEAKPDGTVRLMGQVVRPTLKSDAEARVKRLEGATQVINNIEVLPLSTFDDQLRIALYRKMFNFNSPLFRYGTWSIPPIHIIVSNGHVTLKGFVANRSDSQLAYFAARQTPNVFDVKNELQTEDTALETKLHK
jgi:hyperosmotically inducible periplasmic protein